MAFPFSSNSPFLFLSLFPCTPVKSLSLFLYPLRAFAIFLFFSQLLSLIRVSLCLFNQTPDSVFITSTNLSAPSSDSFQPSGHGPSSSGSRTRRRKQWRNEITGSLRFCSTRNRDVLLSSFRVIRCNPPRACVPCFLAASFLLLLPSRLFPLFLSVIHFSNLFVISVH